MNGEGLKLAVSALKEAENRASADFGYLSYPLGLLHPTITDDGVIFTDGKTINAGAERFLEIVAEDGLQGAERALLHMLLHVLFLHPFRIKRPAKIYDAACDIAVCSVLDGIGDLAVAAGLQSRKAVYKAIKGKYGAINEAYAFAYLISLGAEEAEKTAVNFRLCDHSSWFGRNAHNDDNDAGQQMSIPNPASGNNYDAEDEKSENAWIEIVRGALSDVGGSDDDLKRTLISVVSGRRNYRRFFEKFLSLGERVKPSEDEFDYIFYCYGLSLYKNVPLIENLEYSDVRSAEEVVFAIDTSASTEGEPIKRLLTELATVISSATAQGGKIKVRIIQCDMAIREDLTFYKKSELDGYLNQFVIRGGSGTDFAPVFEKLTAEKLKGSKIRGLIYFTDGLGAFPRETPPFKTCFAIYGDADRKINVPPYAYRLDVDVSE